MSKLSLKQFNLEVNIAIPYLIANLERLQFSKTLATELENFLIQWNKIYPLSEDKSSRTSTMVAERNTLKEKFQKAYHNMQQTIKNNAGISLTDEDYKKLHINIDKKPSSNPAPTKIPKLDIIGRSQSTIRIQVSSTDPISKINYTSMEKGMQVNVEVAIVAVGSPPPTDDDYNLFITSGKSNIDLNFDNKYENMEVYIRAEYFNLRGHSRMSNPINTVIPN